MFSFSTQRPSYISESRDRVRIWRTGRHTPTNNSLEYTPPPPLRDQKKYVAICNISNPSFDIFCTVLLSFPRRCCITKRLLEKREAQQIFKPFRIRWRIFPTLLAVTSSYCLNHHMYTLCGLTVL